MIISQDKATSLDLRLVKDKRNFEVPSNFIYAKELAGITKKVDAEIASYRLIFEGEKYQTKYKLGLKNSFGQRMARLLGGEISDFVITNYPLHTHNFKIPKRYQGRIFRSKKDKRIIESEFGLSHADLRLRGNEKGFVVFKNGNVLMHDRYGNCKILDNPENILFKINQDCTIRALRVK